MKYESVKRDKVNEIRSDIPFYAIRELGKVLLVT